MSQKQDKVDSVQLELIEKLSAWLSNEEQEAQTYSESCAYSKVLRKIEEMVNDD